VPIVTTDIVTVLSALPQHRLIKLFVSGEALVVTRDFAVARARIDPTRYKLITRGSTVRKMIAIENQARFELCWRNSAASVAGPWPGWDKDLSA